MHEHTVTSSKLHHMLLNSVNYSPCLHAAPFTSPLLSQLRDILEVGVTEGFLCLRTACSGTASWHGSTSFEEPSVIVYSCDGGSRLPELRAKHEVPKVTSGDITGDITADSAAHASPGMDLKGQKQVAMALLMGMTEDLGLHFSEEARCNGVDRQ